MVASNSVICCLKEGAQLTSPNLGSRWFRWGTTRATFFYRP